MNYLNARFSVVTFRMREGEPEQAPHVEELQPYVPLTPYFIYDLEGILLTSFRLGELINAANSVRSLWEGEFPGFALINVSAASQKVLEQANLTQFFRTYPDLDTAALAITTKGA